MINDKDLTIVTGGSKGIGYGIARKLAQEGHNVIVFGRDVKDLEKAVNDLKELGAESEYFSGDVSDVEFVNSSIKNIEEKYGKIDHLINNAGLGVFKNLVDADLDDFKKQVNANLYGVFNFSKAVLPGMIKRKSGSVINISSLAGKNFFAGGSMYAATKHGLMGLSKSLMQEVREFNIRVAVVCPGSVDTNFHPEKHPKANTDKILHIEDVADTVAAILRLPVRALISEVEIRPNNPK